jgi:hypothetical protein
MLGTQRKQRPEDRRIEICEDECHLRLHRLYEQQKNAPDCALRLDEYVERLETLVPRRAGMSELRALCLLAATPSPQSADSQKTYGH